MFERAALPLGTYRIVVDGQHWVGSESTWPWTTEDYRLESEPFELLPAELSISLTDTGVEAWIQAPENGYRMIHPSGRSNGANPLLTDRASLKDTLKNTHIPPQSCRTRENAPLPRSKDHTEDLLHEQRGRTRSLPRVKRARLHTPGEPVPT